MSRMLAASGEAGVGGAIPPLPAAAALASTRAIATTRSRSERRKGAGILRAMPERTRVQLPAGVGERLEVFVNGVAQQPGRDYRRQGDELVFDRKLAREG